VTPAYHVGRHKGVKKYAPLLSLRTLLIRNAVYSKRSGLDKAVHQIEQAIKKSKVAGDGSEALSAASELHDLISKSQDLLAQVRQDLLAQVRQDVPASDQPPLAHDRSQSSVSSRGGFDRSQSHGASPSLTQSSEQRTEGDGLTLDDAENPLQLLARTSELLSTDRPSPLHQTAVKPAAVPSRDEVLGDSAEDASLQAFFGRFRPRLDVGPELDPIDVGLVTLPEAETLFTL
jgi:hypothetical protein